MQLEFADQVVPVRHGVEPGPEAFHGMRRLLAVEGAQQVPAQGFGPGRARQVVFPDVSHPAAAVGVPEEVAHIQVRLAPEHRIVAVVGEAHPEALVGIGELVLHRHADRAPDIVGERGAARRRHEAVGPLRPEQSVSAHGELVFLGFAAEHRVVVENQAGAVLAGGVKLEGGAEAGEAPAHHHDIEHLPG